MPTPKEKMGAGSDVWPTEPGRSHRKARTAPAAGAAPRRPYSWDDPTPACIPSDAEPPSLEELSKVFDKLCKSFIVRPESETIDPDGELAAAKRRATDDGKKRADRTRKIVPPTLPTLPVQLAPGAPLVKRTITCRICGRVGHNRVTCPERRAVA